MKIKVEIDEKYAEPNAVIYTNKEEAIKGAEELILDAYTIVDEEVSYKQLIYKII